MMSLILSKEAVTRLVTDGMLVYGIPDPKIGNQLEPLLLGTWADHRFRLGMPPPPEGVFAFTGTAWEEHSPAHPIGTHLVVKERWAISAGAKEADAPFWPYQGWSVWYEDGEKVEHIPGYPVPAHRIPEDSFTPGVWRSPSTMPIWACRFSVQVLHVNPVRAQKLPENTVGRVSRAALQNNWWVWCYSLALNQRWCYSLAINQRRS